MNVAVSETREMGSIMTKTKKVILWGREDMLGRGVGLFLNSRAGWEVIRITEKYNEDFLLHEVEKVQPDVVIIYQGDYASETNIPAQLITNYPNIKVITVSLEDNDIEVYKKQKIQVKEVADLFSIVDA